MAVKVLIVEDNPVARQFLTRVVKESFSDVSGIGEAGDLESARRALGVGGMPAPPVEGEPYRLVLVDLELPDGNGLDLLKDMNGHLATRIVTTLYSDDDHLFPALQAGADGYLLKEDRFEVLVEALQKIVRGEPPLSPAIARRMMSHFRLGDSGATPLDSQRGDLRSARPQPVYSEPDHERLTPRETEVLTYLSKGFTIKEIAGLIGIKWFTVNDHIKAIYRKLNVSSRAEAAVLASKQGLV
jgi:DNA-binding NarL/FixJ family response regulator